MSTVPEKSRFELTGNVCEMPLTSVQTGRLETMIAVKFLSLICLLSCTQIGWAKDPLDIWTWRNPLPTGAYLFRAAYGNGQFVVVGESGTVLTSADGINWVPQTIP